MLSSEDSSELPGPSSPSSFPSVDIHHSTFTLQDCSITRSLHLYMRKELFLFDFVFDFVFTEPRTVSGT